MIVVVVKDGGLIGLVCEHLYLVDVHKHYRCPSQVAIVVTKDSIFASYGDHLIMSFFLSTFTDWMWNEHVAVRRDAAHGPEALV